MKIFEYDICDGDKGIILAESYDRAVEIFNKHYDSVDLENYDSADINDDRYEYGGTISEICDYNGEEELVCIVS